MEPEKCLNCQLELCFNLYRQEKDLEGGELFVLEESIRQKKIAICCIIVPLECCCKLLQAASKGIDTEKMEFDPFLEMLWQCFYDLRTSAFLAITAHYRGAIQLLRPVIENILLGLYFKKRINQAGSNQLEFLDACEDFSKWKEDKFKISAEDYENETGRSMKTERSLDFGFIVAWLNNRKLIDGKEISRLEVLQGSLNKYLHSSFIFMDIGKGERCSRCPAVTRFDKDNYDKWLDLFQNIVDIAIQNLLTHSFVTSLQDEKAKDDLIDVTDEVKDALCVLRGLLELERDLKMELIKSAYLKKLISEMDS